MTKITQDINQRVRTIADELNHDIMGRADVIHGCLVGRIAGQHVVMRGPGGTAKSMLQRSLTEHIDDAVRFEVALDETTDPSQVFGPPDIKAMAEDGKVRRVITGMLPEATDAFLDEFFNGNIPLLHSIMPILNERLFHNNGMPHKTPLRQVIMGTNKFNLDPDLAALFDRVHIRYDIGYINDRDQLRSMVAMAVDRMASKGRGAATNTGKAPTTVTVDELDTAFRESLELDVPEAVLDLYLDIQEELREKGIAISNRRFNEGMYAVLGNAWFRNHDEVKPVDLDILAQMWWTHDEQISTARSIILAAANPGEKKALDLLDSLDEIMAEVRKADVDDEERKRRVTVEGVRNVEKLMREAETEKKNAEDAGLPPGRLVEVITKAEAFKMRVAAEVFGIKPADLARTSA